MQDVYGKVQKHFFCTVVYKEDLDCVEVDEITQS